MILQLLYLPHLPHLLRPRYPSLMSVPSKYLPWLFALLLFVISIPSLLSVWALRLLYLDHHLQQIVQQEMTAFVDTRGLLLSDIALTEVDEKMMKLKVRQYERGRDPRSCFVVKFSDHSAQPCASAY